MITPSTQGATTDLPPPIASVGVLGWLKKNLFSTPLNTIFTLFGLYLFYLFIPSAVSWLVVNADWKGETREACSSGGACWVFIKVRLFQILYGYYPPDQIWRPNLALMILIGLCIPLFMKRFIYKLYLGGIIIFIFPFLAFGLIHGQWFGLDVIETDLWGGFMLTFVLASMGIIGALPIGILMALGRRSKMPIIRALSVTYIELWRGTPLVTVLFMASVMLPLFFPEEVDFDKLARACIGITLFQAAYTAEAIRGGLQAIEKGQYEAADSLGLTYWHKTGFIILPQALKISIPGIVNSFIELFKDTTLVAIIALLDLLEMARVASRSQEWRGYELEAYIFAAMIFWICCYAMSRYSQSLERKLDTGHKA